MRVIIIALAATAMGLMTASAAVAPFIDLRPLTPTDKTAYGLPSSTQVSGGLSTVGIGQPVYLDALVDIAIAKPNILDVTWALTEKPSGSAAVLQESPLGDNVPMFEPSDRRYMQLVGRKLVRPDLLGNYMVEATVTTTTGQLQMSQKITASTFMGLNTCTMCHSGSSLTDDKVTPWSGTGHATFFTRAIDGEASDHYGKNCISCHVLGYDTNTNAVNGGFDDISTQLGYQFPIVFTNGNWAAMPAKLKNVSNIQCENCHGPGSEHAAEALATGGFLLGEDKLISAPYASGDCGQCHDAMTHHFRNSEWNNSRHAVATRTPSGPTRAACARCHTAAGFAAYTATLDGSEPWTGTNVAYTTYEAISCAACHNPHDASNPHQLRAGSTIKLADGEKIATFDDAGAGALCMNCHQSRSGSYTNSLVEYPLNRPTYPGGSSSFGPHDNPAAEMLMGVNGYTYGKDIPSSAHRFAVEDTCVGCHMQEAEGTPAFTVAGGHTFSMAGTKVVNGVTNTIEMVEVCIKCHGEMESFDLVKSDYNGDGIIEGVQTEVQKLLDRLSTMLPPSGSKPNSEDYVADGLVKTRISTQRNWPARFLQAAWNWQLVNNDLSKGIHNSKYAVGLLKASIADLSDDANEDGIADSWQRQYFGDNWASNPNAMRNASPAGDGVPNWLKYTLGLNPTVPGVIVPDGVVWANGNAIGGEANTIHIYTAAEVAFDTQVGKTYQIQAASAMSAGWENVGPSIPGTGNAISYVTPTRQDVQQFFRVVTQ